MRTPPSTASNAAVALVAVALLLPVLPASADPPVDLWDVVEGAGGSFIPGTREGQVVGVCVSGAGDVNGDGLDDIIVGTSAWFTGPGECYVIFGRAGTGPFDLLAIEAGAGGFPIFDLPGDYACRIVAAAGDVNGDGLDDVLVSAYGRDDARGVTSVVFGKADGEPVHLVDVAAGVGGFAIRGADANDASGRSLAPLGDLDGDGLSDLLIGATGADPGGRGVAGESYVVFGKRDTAAVELADVAAGSGGFVINGAAAGDASGWSVAGAGDVNGDGLPDAIIGARLADPNGVAFAGSAFVVFGKRDTMPVELAAVAAGAGGFVIEGQYGQGYAGSSVSGPGDANGDGRADILVGAPLASPGGPASGAAYLVFGKPDGAPVALADVEAGTGGFAMIGTYRVPQYAGPWAGESVSGVGDFDGDGLMDLLVGAPYGHLSVAEPNAGKTFLVFGKADTAPIDLADTIAGTDGLVVNGIAWSRTGDAVAGAGDTDGDGVPDILIGAAGHEACCVDQSGAAFLVLGRAWSCPYDLDGDGEIGFGDLLRVLSDWGPICAE